MSYARPKSKPGLFRLAYHRFFGGSRAEASREYDREFDREPTVKSKSLRNRSRSRKPNTSEFTRTFYVDGPLPPTNLSLVLPRDARR